MVQQDGIADDRMFWNSLIWTSIYDFHSGDVPADDERAGVLRVGYRVVPDGQEQIAHLDHAGPFIQISILKFKCQFLEVHSNLHSNVNA